MRTLCGNTLVVLDKEIFLNMKNRAKARLIQRCYDVYKMQRKCTQKGLTY